MKRLLAALALAVPAACGAAAAAGSGDDPMDSPACKAARAELERLLDQRTRPGALLEQARRRASDACLGRSGGTRQRSGAPDPPLAVPPAAVAPPPQVPPPIAGPPPLAIPHPTTITTCDAAGCWDSEGRRLDQTGPFLLGPRGLCTVQGGLVTCP